MIEERATDALAPAESAELRDCESASPPLFAELADCESASPVLVALDCTPLVALLIEPASDAAYSKLELSMAPTKASGQEMVPVLETVVLVPSGKRTVVPAPTVLGAESVCMESLGANW